MDEKRFFQKHMIRMVLMGIVLAFVISGLLMVLWNWLIPGIFGLRSINFWEAGGLFIISKILFGAFPGRHHNHHMHDMHHGNPMRERWMKMTDEERNEFIKHRMGHFHHHHPFSRNDVFGKGYGQDNANENSDQQQQH